MKERMFFTGVTNDTPENLLLNAGVLLSSFDPSTPTIPSSDIIGATRGGATFSAVPTIHQVAADGAPTNMVGMDRIDEWVVTLNATLIEFKEGNIQLAFGSSLHYSEVQSQTHDVAKYDVEHDLINTDYKDIWWVGPKSDGSIIAIHIVNGLNKSGFTVTVTDKGEATLPISIIAHYDMSMIAQGKAPFEIYNIEEKD